MAGEGKERRASLSECTRDGDISASWPNGVGDLGDIYLVGQLPAPAAAENRTPRA